MRLWSIHPSYLDTKGLLGVWREGLLAQKVLMGLTRGYRNHPQLIRFKATKDPVTYLGNYLYFIYLEGERRGYNFKLEKIVRYDLSLPKLPVKRGQLEYEFQHLLKKLRWRDPDRYELLKNEKKIQPHPIFFVIEGGIESWEVIVK
ncbi:MAG: pyrimidine dimer DNA glycosylase/endonuclease V [Sulfolobus sp.]